MKSLDNSSAIRFTRTFLELIMKLFAYPYKTVRRIRDNRAIFKASTLEDRFTFIYKRNIWGSRESQSGFGSTVEFTHSIRSALPQLISKFEVHSMFDAPCGDFNWMQKVELSNVIYVGADIVRPMISKLQSSFENNNRTFICLDITKDPYPKCDLMLNRDCLFHLSYCDILKVLNMFVDSNIEFFLSTSHNNDGTFKNIDIESGDFRPIDLFEPPFNFSKDVLFEIPEPSDGEIPARKLYLWNRKQVEAALSNLANALSGL